MREGHGMVEIHGLAFRLGAILVDQHDLCGKTAEKQSIGEGRSDIACAPTIATRAGEEA